MRCNEDGEEVNGHPARLAATSVMFITLVPQLPHVDNAQFLHTIYYDTMHSYTT